jgi:hypothetical protein
MKTVESQDWIIDIPDDWDKKESDIEGKLYFESEDKTNGLYISTHFNRDSLEYNNEKIISNLNIDKTHLKNMSGYNFKIANEKIFNDQGLIIGLIDSFDKSKNYRICIKYIAYRHIFVRLTCHDYDFNDSDLTTNIIDEILDSLRLKHKLLN